MDFQDCIKFANDHHTCYLATVDGDQPRVRPMGMWFADKTGFYFESKSVKALHKQLEKNPKVEVAFYAPEAKPSGKVMRVTGKIEFINDMELRKRLYEEKPRLKAQGVKGPEDPLMTIFRISTGEAFFWTMASNMYEADIERIKF
jgi:pyridoxamine 5'-phosphate oxidase